LKNDLVFLGQINIAKFTLYKFALFISIETFVNKQETHQSNNEIAYGNCPTVRKINSTSTELFCTSSQTKKENISLSFFSFYYNSVHCLCVCVCLVRVEQTI